MTSPIAASESCVEVKHAADKIVIVTTSFPSRGDGSEAAGSFVADMAVEIARTRRVRVVAPGEQAARETWLDGIEVFRFPVPSGRTLSTLLSFRLGDVAAIFKIMRAGQAATREAIDEKTCGVIAMWGLPCGEWVRRACQKRAIPYAVWLLGSDVWSLGRVPVVRQWLGKVIRAAEIAYADGFELCNAAQRIAGVPITFLPTTRRILTRTPNAPSASPPYRIIFLGRWHKNKGIDLFLGALALLDDADWGRIESVAVFGGGPLESVVRQEAGKLKAQGRPVQVHGFLPKADAEMEIARADWLVIPSRIESIPVVFSDAMKLGRPVISTPVGDLPRLVEGPPACGVLADAVSAVGIATALRSALRSSPVHYELGIAQTATQFDLESIAERITSRLCRA